MYFHNQKQIENEINDITQKLNSLGVTDIKSYFTSVGVCKYFTFRVKCLRTGRFADCSPACREKDDHDSHLCALRQLLKIVQGNI
jgi:hypothetical protein